MMPPPPPLHCSDKRNLTLSGGAGGIATQGQIYGHPYCCPCKRATLGGYPLAAPATAHPNTNSLLNSKPKPSADPKSNPDLKYTLNLNPKY